MKQDSLAGNQTGSILQQEKKYFDITYIYYYPDGSIMDELKYEHYIECYLTCSNNMRVWGWPYSGNWSIGTYIVVIIVEDIDVAKGTFEIN